MRDSRTNRARRGGYTLIELLVVNILMTLLVILIAVAWRAFGPLCVEVIARGRIVNEANIAAQALYQDANNPHLTLTKVETPDGASLQFDYGTLQADGTYPLVILYSLQTPQDPPGSTEIVLVRSVGSSSVTIARHLVSAVATPITLTGSKSQVNFTLTFAYQVSQNASNVSQSQYTFAVHN